MKKIAVLVLLYLPFLPDLLAQSTEMKNEATQLKQLLDRKISESFGDIPITEKEKRFVAKLDSLLIENKRIKAEISQLKLEKGNQTELDSKPEIQSGVARGILFFESKSFTLDNQDKWLVRKWLSEVQAQQIKIYAYTDAYGELDYNKELAKKRANAVLRYLRELGCEAEISLVVQGPIQDATGEQASLGRRVELSVN